MTKWISAKRRLPKEEDGTVAVLCDDGSILTAWVTYWHGASNAFAQWTFPHQGDDDRTVTHWYPLPQVPNVRANLTTGAADEA